MGWNELQARAGLPPHDLSRRLDQVREHLKAAVSPEDTATRPTSPPQP
jgi:hypothetical protein